VLHRSTLITTGMLAVSMLAACSREPAPQARAADPATATAPAAAPASLPAMQPSRTGRGQEGPRTVTGTVVETMNAANYTYVRVKTEDEELWAATGQFDVKVGQRVTVPLEMAMENFHSQTLNRDFPAIYFVSQITREGEPGRAAPAGGSPHRTAQPSPGDLAPITSPMQPPPGGTTVANVWADRKALAGKPVTVRGKVTKYNGGILGVNWVHIQDGTGAAAQKTNDLAITTDDTARVGDIVIATGTLATDKDFGAGYAYPVILEKSTLKR
jgi:hypothetical protein